MTANNVVPAALTGPRTCWHVLSQHPAFPQTLRGAAGKRRFAAHLEALRASGAVLETEHVRANRHRTVQLVARPDDQKGRKF
jgi:hypothetical protein